MKEIEQIISPFNILSKKPLIEAIEQYVIKARIEERKAVTYESKYDWFVMRRDKRIAELEKEL